MRSTLALPLLFLAVGVTMTTATHHTTDGQTCTAISNDAMAYGSLRPKLASTNTASLKLIQLQIAHEKLQAEHEKLQVAHHATQKQLQRITAQSEVKVQTGDDAEYYWHEEIQRTYTAATACTTEEYEASELSTFADRVCSAMQTCAAGTFISDAGSATSDRTCSDCPAGEYSDTTDAASCTACPANTYSASAGATACTACASGSTSDAGATSCTIELPQPDDIVAWFASSNAAASWVSSVGAYTATVNAGTVNVATAADAGAVNAVQYIRLRRHFGQVLLW